MVTAVRRRAQEDAGVSLPEVLVTMAIFSAVMAIVFQALIAVQSQTSKVEGSAAAVSQVRAGLAQIDKQIRSGNVLYSPADEPAAVASCTSAGTAGTCMRVYTQANGTQRCVQWQVIADPARPGTSMLRSRGWAAGPVNVSSWATVARGLSTSPSVMPFTLQGGATAYKSRLLDVHLEAVDPRRPGKPIVISSSLAGRNTNYGYDTGLCSPVPPE